MNAEVNEKAVKSFLSNEGVKGACWFYAHYLRMLARMCRLQLENEVLKRRLRERNETANP